MPTPADRTVVDAKLLAATKGLILSARKLVEGAVAGLHASRRPGLAQEFSQYRAYQPGDEPRHIDWKLFARSDRYFLRESDVDTRLTVNLLVDATESMQHTGGATGVPRKFDSACALAAAVAFLAEAQGDPVTLHIVTNGNVRTVITGGERQPFRQIVTALLQSEPAGRWPADGNDIARALRRAELHGTSTGSSTHARIDVVLTDGHEHGGEIRNALASLRARQHEVVLIRLTAPDEQTFPYSGPTRFEEWETGRVIEADATRVRALFLEHERQEHEAWKRAWGGDRFDYVSLSTDQPRDKGLRAYLRKRMRR